MIDPKEGHGPTSGLTCAGPPAPDPAPLYDSGERWPPERIPPSVEHNRHPRAYPVSCGGPDGSRNTFTMIGD